MIYFSTVAVIHLENSSRNTSGHKNRACNDQNGMALALRSHAGYFDVYFDIFQK